MFFIVDTLLNEIVFTAATQRECEKWLINYAEENHLGEYSVHRYKDKIYYDCGHLFYIKEEK